MKRRPGVERRRRRLANKTDTIDLGQLYWNGSQAVWRKNGKVANDLIQAIFQQMNLDELQKFTAEGKIESHPVNIPKGGGRLASLLGNYFEYCVWNELSKLLNSDSDVNFQGSEVGDEGSRSTELELYLTARGIKNSKVKEFKKQAQDQAAIAAKKFWDDYKLSNPNKMKQMENVFLTWLGGSGGIGDLKLVVGNAIIMIECKFYSSQTYNEHGIGYFNFSDADAQNFGLQFWAYLYFFGSPYWNEKNPESTESWVAKVLNDGFYNYITDSAGSKESHAVLSYLMQKGRKYNINKYFNTTNGSRAIITGEKITEGNNQAKLSVTINLDELLKKDKNDLRMERHQAQLKFTLNQKEIGDLSIPSKDIETITQNSNFNNPNKDGIGWTTHFRFILQRDFLNPF